MFMTIIIDTHHSSSNQSRISAPDKHVRRLVKIMFSLMLTNAWISHGGMAICFIHFEQGAQYTFIGAIDGRSSVHVDEKV